MKLHIKGKAIIIMLFLIILFILSFLQNCLWGWFGMAPTVSYLLIFSVFNLISIIIFTLKFPKFYFLWPTILATPLIIWDIIDLNYKGWSGIQNRQSIIASIFIVIFYLAMFLSMLYKGNLDSSKNMK